MDWIGLNMTNVDKIGPKWTEQNQSGLKYTTEIQEKHICSGKIRFKNQMNKIMMLWSLQGGVANIDIKYIYDIKLCLLILI